MRAAVSFAPLKNPKRRNTSSPYSEHVGWNLQLDGVRGETMPLYKVISPMASSEGSLFASLAAVRMQFLAVFFPYSSHGLFASSKNFTIRCGQNRFFGYKKHVQTFQKRRIGAVYLSHSALRRIAPYGSAEPFPCNKSNTTARAVLLRLAFVSAQFLGFFDYESRKLVGITPARRENPGDFAVGLDGIQLAEPFRRRGACVPLHAFWTGLHGHPW